MQDRKKRGEAFFGISMTTVFSLVFALTLSIGVNARVSASDQNSPQQNDPEYIEELRPLHPWTPMPAFSIGPMVSPPFPSTAPPVLSNTTWTPIGPAPLSTTTSPNANYNVSGRITGIAAHPADSNTIYVAPAGGGVWKTGDGGTTWTPLTDSQSTLSMGAIAIARGNPNVIYAGTGEANNSGDSNYGRGVEGQLYSLVGTRFIPHFFLC